VTAAQREVFAQLGIDPWKAEWSDDEVATVHFESLTTGKPSVMVIHPNGKVVQP
jgi:hypothetical protein